MRLGDDAGGGAVGGWAGRTPMKLTNFELESGIELNGLGHVWDLHNCVDFTGLELIPESGAVRLGWFVLPEFQATGFSRNNPHQGCSLRFDGVTSVLLLRRIVKTMGPSDARTLSQVHFVLPVESTPAVIREAGNRAITNDPKHPLLFEFMGGFDIEIVPHE